MAKVVMLEVTQRHLQANLGWAPAYQSIDKLPIRQRLDTAEQVQ